LQKEIECPCGFIIRADDEDELVAKAQKHAKESHDMELSSEQALSMARPV
jgi:predicted small metal-binding protein